MTGYPDAAEFHAGFVVSRGLISDAHVFGHVGVEAEEAAQ
jgi:formate dehydrogenase assembly factor FdhD